jgi:hypothetical protein
MLPHQLEARLMIVFPNCYFCERDREHSITERIIPRLLHVFYVNPRDIHAGFNQELGIPFPREQQLNRSWRRNCGIEESAVPRMAGMQA